LLAWGREKEILIFKRLVVVLDNLAPYRGAFSYALDWGRRFHLPIKGVARFAVNSADGTWCGIQACLDEHLGATNSAVQPGYLGGESSTEKCACAQLCARWGVRWELARLKGPSECGLAQLTDPGDVLIFGKALPSPLKRELFLQAIRGTTSPLLICSDTWQPSSRVLLVDQGERGNFHFLERASGLCRALEASPVILTVARSERWALRRQREAQDVLVRVGVHADFDFIVRCETRSAVVSVARWRRCSFLVMERESVAPWWRWFRGGGSDWIADLTDSLTIMTLPALPASDGLPEENSGASAEPSFSSPSPGAQQEGGTKAWPAAAEEFANWNPDAKLPQSPQQAGTGVGSGSTACRGVE
jgi:hypothetical protein